MPYMEASLTRRQRTVTQPAFKEIMRVMAEDVGPGQPSAAWRACLGTNMERRGMLRTVWRNARPPGDPGRARVADGPARHANAIRHAIWRESAIANAAALRGGV